MIKINILTPGFTTPNGRAFLFPIIKNYYKLRDENLHISFFHKVNSDLVNANFLCIDSKFYKDQWLDNKQELLKKSKGLKKDRYFIFFDTTDSSSWVHNEMLNLCDKYFKSQVLKNKNLIQNHFMKQNLLRFLSQKFFN